MATKSSEKSSENDSLLPPNISLNNIEIEPGSSKNTNEKTKNIIDITNSNNNNNITSSKILKNFLNCYRYEMKCPYKRCELLKPFPNAKLFKRHYSSKHLTKQERLAKMLQCPIQGIDGKKCDKLSRNFSNLVNHMVAKGKHKHLNKPKLFPSPFVCILPKIITCIGNGSTTKELTNIECRHRAGTEQNLMTHFKTHHKNYNIIVKRKRRLGSPLKRIKHVDTMSNEFDNFSPIRSMGSLNPVRPFQMINNNINSNLLFGNNNSHTIDINSGINNGVNNGIHNAVNNVINNDITFAQPPQPILNDNDNSINIKSKDNSAILIKKSNINPSLLFGNNNIGINSTINNKFLPLPLIQNILIQTNPNKKRKLNDTSTVLIHNMPGLSPDKNKTNIIDCLPKLKITQLPIKTENAIKTIDKLRKVGRKLDTQGDQYNFLKLLGEIALKLELNDILNKKREILKAEQSLKELKDSLPPLNLLIQQTQINHRNHNSNRNTFMTPLKKINTPTSLTNKSSNSSNSSNFTESSIINSQPKQIKNLSIFDM